MVIAGHGFSVLAAAVVVWVTAGSVCAQTVPATDAGADQGVYSIDFRKQHFDPGTLMPIGHDSLYGLRLLKPEPRGLRMIIPSHQGARKPNIGVAPAFEIDGDFEITAGYDLVTAETPKRGAGAGANLYLLASETLQGATLRRCVNPMGEEVYFLHWTALNDDGTRQTQWKYIPAESRRGELGLRRRGSTLYYVAADEKGELKEIHQVNFGTASIGLVRLEAQTDGAASTVDVLWSNFTVRGEKIRPVPIPLYDAATTVAVDGSESDAAKAKSEKN